MVNFISIYQLISMFISGESWESTKKSHSPFVMILLPEIKLSNLCMRKMNHILFIQSHDDIWQCCLSVDIPRAHVVHHKFAIFLLFVVPFIYSDGSCCVTFVMFNCVSSLLSHSTVVLSMLHCQNRQLARKLWLLELHWKLRVKHIAREILFQMEMYWTVIFCNLLN